MEISKWKTGILDRLGKYKYVLVVIIAGIILMSLPEKAETTPSQVSVMQSEETMDPSEQIAELLMMIEGAGKVRVYLSVARGEQILYQTDSTYSENDNKLDTKSQTVLITDGDRNEVGLIYQKNPPTYQGALVVAQGATDPKVKLALVEAVSKVTGLGADRISVLKMK